jgi:hypothetical protein
MGFNVQPTNYAKETTGIWRDGGQRMILQDNRNQNGALNAYAFSER